MEIKSALVVVVLIFVKHNGLCGWAISSFPLWHVDGTSGPKQLTIFTIHGLCRNYCMMQSSLRPVSTIQWKIFYLIRLIFRLVKNAFQKNLYSHWRYQKPSSFLIISGRIKVHLFAQICLIFKAKYGDTSKGRKYSARISLLTQRRMFLLIGMVFVIMADGLLQVVCDLDTFAVAFEFAILTK